MGEKDMHESELNAAQPARRPKKKKRGRAGKVIRKTVKIVVVLVLAVGAGYCVTLESGETRRVTLGMMTDETTQILDGIGVGETVIY